MPALCLCAGPAAPPGLVPALSPVRTVAPDRPAAAGRPPLIELDDDGGPAGGPACSASDPRKFDGCDWVVVVGGAVDRALVLEALHQHVSVLYFGAVAHHDRSELMVFHRVAALAGATFAVPGHRPTPLDQQGDAAVCRVPSAGLAEALALASRGPVRELLRLSPGQTVGVLDRADAEGVGWTVAWVDGAALPTTAAELAGRIRECLASRACWLGEAGAVEARAVLEAAAAIRACPARVPVPRFRVYRHGVTPARVAALYREQRRRQSHTAAMRLTLKYCTGGNRRCTVWEALGLLRTIVDKSDPDVLTLANDAHALQTAAMLERDGHPEHLVAIGLVHDLGKIVATFGCDADGTSAEQQWATVGDTFVTGHPIPGCVPFPEFNPLNPDAGAASVYPPGCGLDSVVCTMGHDEYLYRALVRNRDRHTLPDECLYIARYHSLYPWHSGGAYIELESARDREMKPYVRLFQAYDLYSKDDALRESWDDPKWRALVERVFGTEPWDW